MTIKQLTKQIKHLDIVTNRKVTEMFAGNYKSSFKGRGLEVSDIREYAEGDDFRHIDWISTAKQGKLYVKKFQETRELSTLLIVDLSSSMNFTTQKKTKKQTSLELSATILFSALKNNDKFGALLFSDDIKTFIPPKKGKAHLLRVLREIITGFENNYYQKTNSKKALEFLNLTAPKNTVCFFISDDLEKESVSTLKVSAKKHDFVFCRIQDPFEKNITADDIIHIQDPETGELFIIDLKRKKTRQKFHELQKEKQNFTKQTLLKNRIDFFELSTNSNIYKELLLFFKKRQARF